jgi:hypothetical protein
MKMIRQVALILCVATIGDFQNMSNASYPQALPEVFRSVLIELKEQVQIPILLPKALPKPIEEARHVVVSEQHRDHWAVLLYYELHVGDAGCAGAFSGVSPPSFSLETVPNVRRIQLHGGSIGFFRKVSCGGSCAPANLWWVQDRVLYQIQLKLASNTREDEQEKLITDLANSAISAGPR